MSGTLRFEILGPQRAWYADRQLNLGPGKQRAVLAVLLLSAGRPVSTGQIVEAVWPEEPPANGPNVVQKYVAGLRRVLEPDRSPRTPGQVLSLTDAGYLLRVDPEAVDAVRFERGVRRAERHRAAGRTADAAAELRAALELWHGEPFGGLSGPVLEAARQRLVETRATALETWAELELEQGRHRELIGGLVELVAEFPVRERLRYQYLLALYRNGRQAEALAAYREIDDLLREEYGIEPGEALQGLHRRILRADPTLAPTVPSPRPESPDPTAAASDRPAGPPPDTAEPAPGLPASTTTMRTADVAAPLVPAPPAGPAARHPAAPEPAAAAPPIEQPPPPLPVPPPAPPAPRPAPALPYAAVAPPRYPGPGGFPAGAPPILPDRPRRERHPLPRWVSATATIAGTVLVLLSFGFVTWLVILGYAVRRRSWRLGQLAVGYLAAAALVVYLIATDDPTTEVPVAEAFFGLGLVTLCWVVGAAQVVLLNRWVWGKVTGRPLAVQARDEEQRLRREQARYLVHHYPTARQEFAIGRPDLPRAFDDGGLVDVNAVPDSVLATLPGLTDAQRRQVAMERWLRGPYGSMEELAARCQLPLAVTDGLRDILLFLPPPSDVGSGEAAPAEPR
ncbi:winged helix-turn-helix domain-containing protein [Micromonospora sp. U56]|uniref:AfsR/SARP family transcriptional regulator n=1 Tax=Micromonospora sp. U56 TaxID=2824900 RepID=UPI001B381224|nr:AfsR/SARP family transcriptional regulator [Micromonospora sp. U56]MBQ0894389.1 winged helix-turn-helix domain-containing protein [Micromonospora sp. U56]